MSTSFFSRAWNHVIAFLGTQQNTKVKDTSAWLTGVIVYVSSEFLGLPIEGASAAILGGFIARTIAGLGK